MYAVTILLHCSDLDKLDEVRQASLEVVSPSLAESGCLFFDVLFDETDQGVIRFYEAYRTREDFEAHLQMDHTQNWVKKCMPYIERSSIRMPESESKSAVNQDRVVVVFGATGKIGTEMIKLLSADPRCREVRALTRNPDGARAKLLCAMSESVTAYSSADDSLNTVCQGATDAFIIAPVSDEMEEWHKRVASALKLANVEHVVKVSVTGARSPESDPPPGRFPSLHWAGEEALRQVGLKTTVIRPTIFMQHFEMGTGIYEQGDHRVFLPTGDKGVAFLDCRDIAAMGHALLLSPTAIPFHGGAYELTGPQAITAGEMTQILSALNGDKFFSHIDDEENYVARCEELNKADWAKFIYAEAAEGWFSKLEQEVFKQVVGRYPRSFAQYVSDNRMWFSISSDKN